MCDVLVVDKGRQLVHGDLGVAALNGEFIVKRLQRQHGRLPLKVENPAYPDLIPSGEQQLQIWVITVVGCVWKF